MKIDSLAYTSLSYKPLLHLCWGLKKWVSFQGLRSLHVNHTTNDNVFKKLKQLLGEACQESSLIRQPIDKAILLAVNIPSMCVSRLTSPSLFIFL